MTADRAADRAGRRARVGQVDGRASCWPTGSVGRSLDVDAVIEERAGKPIAEIFVDDGEPAFRALEEATTARAARPPGGAVPRRRRGAVRRHPAGAGRAPRGLAAGRRRHAAVDRVGLNTARPLLLGNVRGRLIQLLNQRTPLYAEVATVTVTTDDLTADEVVAVDRRRAAA